MAQTLVEKIAQLYSDRARSGAEVRSGDMIRIRPRHVMTHDNTGAVMKKFAAIGATKVFEPRQPVFCIDHDIQNTSEENLAKYRAIEEFARRHGIAFHPAGSGIGHQILVEEGYVIPGSLCVASDSHANLYGAVAALGTPVVRTDAAALWATGSTWWEVPDVARVRLNGKLGPGVSGKDVIVSLIGTYRKDEVLNLAVEFVGPGVEGLTMDERMTIANMTTEWGALVGIFPCDEVTLAWYEERARSFRERGDTHPKITSQLVDKFRRTAPAADPDAFYAKEIEFDLAEVTPHVAGPNEVKTIVPVDEIARKGIPVKKAYLLSCVNARLSDFEQAAAVVRGKKVAEGVELYIAAASASVQREAERLGYWKDLLDAGARELPPGCGPCIGLGTGTLEAGEVGISATNRNFKGRMGSRDALVYLASPAVVAASAVAGTICGPGEPGESRGYVPRIRDHERPGGPGGETAILEGFPAAIEGRLLFLPKDNMNTDGIYGKEFTYRDDLPPDEMGSKAFLNYDPRFQEIAERGDLVVGGANFGSGSSREQAATALQFRGIRLVIAASYSQTYKRNAFNNGYPLVESPSLVGWLRERHSAEAGKVATIDTGLRATVDFRRSRVTVEGREFPFLPLGEVAQRLIIDGGVENQVRREIGVS